MPTVAAGTLLAQLKLEGQVNGKTKQNTEIKGTDSTHRILLEQLTVFQLLNLFHALCETIRLIAAFTIFRYLIRSTLLNLPL
jgi:hypothetical protein